MSKETEAAFNGWESEGFSGDEVHYHFRDIGARDPHDIYVEGCRLLGLLTKREIDTGSVYGQILYGAACQAGHGALADVAEMFGLDARQFELTVNTWHAQKNKCQVPVALDNFLEFHRSAQAAFEIATRPKFANKGKGSAEP